MQVYDKDGKIARGCKAIAKSDVWKGRKNIWRGNIINRAEIFRILVTQELQRLTIREPENIADKIKKMEKVIEQNKADGYVNEILNDRYEKLIIEHEGLDSEDNEETNI
ncbi:MAG: hypothetical protein GY834_02225 [Bacteroidetes bacterium]|nr:hypothetical protein [Bacteroidota bacterium]